MKRMIVLALTLVLCGSAIAEGNAFGIDWTLYEEAQIKATISELYRAIDEANAELESRSSTPQAYHVGNVDFTVNFYRYDGALSYASGEGVLVEVSWKNVSTKAIKFQTSVTIKGYQNGKAMDDMPLLVSRTPTKSEETMPGYGDTNYAAFELTDSSDVTIMISDPWDDGNVDKSITFTLKPSELKDYE